MGIAEVRRSKILDDAREKVEGWRQNYSREKPRGSLGDMKLLEFTGALVSK